ncbi:hypothetical protein Tco_0443572 [Tanacetum coccineum]
MQLEEQERVMQSDLQLPVTCVDASVQLLSELKNSLTPCMAIDDVMQSLQSPIGTHRVGYIYNLAGFLLASAEKIASTD